jgi:predicted RNase H-like HicB family nuclease
MLDSSHENKWVAIAPDYSRVLAAANTLSDLIRLVTDLKAVFHRPIPRDVSLAFPLK